MLLPNCYYCGRFVGYKSAYITWTLYGSPIDQEPGDPDFAHTECYYSNDSKLLDQVSYLKPIQIGAI